MANFYSFSQAATELQYRLGNRTDLGVGTANRIALWLDTAQIKIASTVMAIETLDVVGFPMHTVSGQSEYGELQILPPANNVIGLRGFRNDSQGVQMFRFPWTEYRSLNQQAQSTPLRWARLGYTWAFDPQPDDVYEVLIDYRRSPQRGISELPNRFQDDWITTAEWIAWKALLKPDRAATAFSLLPPQLQGVFSKPLDREQFEAMWDTQLSVRPIGMDPMSSYGYGGY